ncbi:MAG: CDP-diacylglycerol--glycerol-3-phosphate 3-phosphatidyltransferase [Bryobacteraceae bacterium]
MNLPNLLTLLRIFFVPLLVAALLADGTFVARWQQTIPVSREMFALAVFLAAAATDLLDGFLARRWKQVTTVGTLLDPIADKLLISAALVSLVDIHRVAAWIVILIIGREFAVSGLRSIAAASGYIIKASELGKTKMASQVAAISLVIAGTRWPRLDEPGLIGMWLVMIFGIVSAADYFRKFWRKVDDQVKRRRRKELLRLERQQQRRAAHAHEAARRMAPVGPRNLPDVQR